MTHFLFFSTFFVFSMCREKCLRDLLDTPHHSRRRHLGRAWMERSERTVRRIHHHQRRHLLKAKIRHGNEVRMAQAGADTRFGANEIPHLLITTKRQYFHRS
ncbi:MAG TPA: hypothetical protein VGN15_10145 [Ktedonobacteraceae bacterium]|nr:hypothetical protein [Ktedonobacteraceae bacterium]